ncbi:MAG: glycosyltransferase family 4 protein [Acidobacteria bacterium]|jgi:glycosyltransferase involved in cell wall biosynthesis|nr:glycosyltransferase family 4 protein [Acidobacteriota bacterium]
MKVLLVNDYGVLAGGAERITVDLRDGLRARGHDARLLASSAGAPAQASLADYTCRGSNGTGRLLLQAWNPWAVSRLRQVLAEFQPDIVHVRMFLTQLSPAVLKWLPPDRSLLHIGNHQTICPLNSRVLPDGSRCGVRAGVECHRQRCVSTFGLGRTLLQLRTWRRHSPVFRCVVANSHAIAATLRENGVPVDTVIPNGTRVVPPRPSLTGPPTVVFAGRLVPQKGLDLLVQAMAIVVTHQPDARLVIVGDGPDRARIEELIGMLKLRDRVQWRGHIPHPALAEALGTGWVQVLASRSPEPGANVIPEAMMRGTAVVATRFDGAPEGLRDTVTGFLVPPFDVQALADRLVTLLGDRALAERMGQAGRDVALAELTTDLMIDRFEAVYATLG